MPRKGGGDEPDTGKGGKARAQKAAAAAEKDRVKAAADEAAEAAAWEDGANKKAAKRAADDKARQEEAARKKAEIEQQLKREEEEIAAGRKLRGSDKVAARQAQKIMKEGEAIDRHDAPTLEARGIDAALAVMTIATGADGGGASAGGGGDDHERAHALLREATTGIKADDAHPERRMKAAFKRYEERELPVVKAEFPTLRRSQLNEMIFRRWQKSPENPMVAAEAERRKKDAEGR